MVGLASGALGLASWELIVLVRAAAGEHVGGIECLVCAENGEVVPEPACLVRFPDGRPDHVPKRRVGILIPDRVADSGGRIMLTAPGCGWLERAVGRQETLTLPPPVRLEVEVPGRFPLPTGAYGIQLLVRSESPDAQVAALLDRAPVAAGYWEQPRAARSRQIWIDPATRSVSVLLPRTGLWRIEWIHTRRLEQRGFGLVFGEGACTVRIETSGEHHQLAIRPPDLTGIMEPDR